MCDQLCISPRHQKGVTVLLNTGWRREGRLLQLSWSQLLQQNGGIQMDKLHKMPRNFITADMTWKLLRHRKKLLQPACKKTKSSNYSRYILTILSGVTEHKCGAPDAAEQCFLLVTGPLVSNQVSLCRTYRNFFHHTFRKTNFSEGKMRKLMLMVDSLRI